MAKVTKDAKGAGGELRIPRQARGQGVRECLDHVGPENEMPATFTVTGTTSGVATDVNVLIHNRVQPLDRKSVV